jgi:hypothetical protein
VGIARNNEVSTTLGDEIMPDSLGDLRYEMERSNDAISREFRGLVNDLQTQIHAISEALTAVDSNIEHLVLEIAVLHDQVSTLHAK